MTDERLSPAARNLNLVAVIVFVTLCALLLVLPGSDTSARIGMAVGLVFSVAVLVFQTGLNALKPRFSLSTVFALLTAAFATSGYTFGLGWALGDLPYVSQFLFFGCQPLAALITFILASVQLFRKGSLQFLAEIALAELAFLHILWAGSQL